ncbi:sulfotransferase [Sphingobium sp. HBC34]|uniref:Sulfotransferase n=1 Tax=Sphingobium cyanobacteriorum TaxID=3063954 RepID=A0ABT8ZGX6_9SPHN|nr:sulfotransferase [Sphingobium sp. HBC34]MDO7833422.1 sulfotransferase [Sphingobium sp. HBC34]
MMTQTWQSRFDALHQRAAEQAGLHDFGDTGYHKGLRVLLESLDEEGVKGGKAAVAESAILAAFAARLQAEAQWKAHPEYRTREIPAPLIVIGVPRTGTTALHNLLSQDAQFQGIERWICDAPLVRPARESWESHPQYKASVALYEQFMAVAPQAMVAHGVKPDDVDECLLPMAQSFCSNNFPSQLDLAGYDNWLMTADETPSYSRYKDVLRLVGLHDDRRWLLKNPSHVFGIDALLAVFPDACIVQTHRHPADSIASVTSLLDNFMSPLFGEPIDRQRRLKREADFWSEGVRRTMAAQDRAPDRFVNVLQKDIRVDPLGVVRKIYAQFGLALSAEAEAAMRAWAERNAQAGGEGHSYEKIGRDDPLIDPFAPYIERYGL